MRIRIDRISVVVVAAAGMLCAQPRPAPVPPTVRDQRMMGPPPGKFWDNPEMVRRLNLTADQQKKLDDVFQQSRLKLIDLHAALEKEEAMLEPLMRAAQPDDSKVLPEIDRIAQARAELEKANARLLLGIRHVLTPEQWETLQRDQMQQRQMPRPREGGNRQGPPPMPPPPPQPR